MRKYHSRGSSNALRPCRSSEHGATLVIVLAILVLVAILIVGFLTRATSERSASASYHATATARQLADTAVNLVQAQINDATSAGLGHTWASQPGAVRVFDDNGQLTKVYRLYSAASMNSDITNPSVLASDVPSGDWASSPALWTDLNAPVLFDDLNGTQQSIFPILDPRDPTDPGTPQVPKVTTKIDGFQVASAPGATSTQPVPMPARWLYVLQNGQVVAPSGEGQSVTVTDASPGNPIVGRIAFWTDDESSKVNINTAAGNLSKRENKLLPAPWDIPRFRIYDERLLFSENQPVSGEYQRYPGHPANTDLSRIFDSLGMPNMATIDQAASGTASDFFKLLPRLNDDNGSKGGTVNTTKSNVQTAVTAKAERLFSSLGELSFNPLRVPNNLTRQQLESGKFFLTSNSRAPEVTLFGTPRIINWPIDSDYGKDPVPGNPTKLASTFDKVIAFCGTTGTGSSRKQYYFQRHDSTSPTNDYTQIKRNQDLYSYLQRVTGQDIPGYGGNFVAKYKGGERDQILTEMVDYIRSTNVYDHAIKDADKDNPSPRFTPKWGNTGWGQVVPLKIGDTRGLGRMYTISEVGLLIIATADGNGKLPSENGSAEDWRSASNLPEDQMPAIIPKLKKSDGTEVDFEKNPTLSDNFGAVGTALGKGQKRLQAMLLIEVASPMLGFDQMRPNIRVSVSGMNDISIGGKTPFPSGKLINSTPGSRLSYVNESGGINGFQYFISRVDGGQKRVNGWKSSDDTIAYKFVSIPFTVPTDDTGQGELPLSGSVTIQLEVPQKGSSSDPVAVQVFNVKFPETKVPVPDLIQKASKTKNIQTSVEVVTAPSTWWGFDRRIFGVSSLPALDGVLREGSVIRTDPPSVQSGVPLANWNDTSKAEFVPVNYYKNTDGTKIDPTKQPASDVVRTLIAQGGDTRLVMAKETVDANGSSSSADMTAHPGYFDEKHKLVHSFMQMNGANLVPGVDLGGKLVPGAPYDKMWAPKVPSNMTPGADWDWDSGLPGTADGAYANKPDEGNIYTGDAQSKPYYNAEQQVNQQNLNNLTSYFTANRIIPSAVMFGSLPTGVKEGIPWRTLLFRPQKNRPRDASGPKDYLLLDLFSMPVVEPYAISEPFSTAGKVNMNYQILPFTYITRNSSVRAVLGSELIARIPKKAAGLITGNATQSYYKVPYGNLPVSGGAQTSPTMARLPLNLSDTDGTLRQFKSKFDSWDIFKSPSEICDVYLVPEGYSWASDNAADAGWYGDDFAMVGDNVRERPYANIYPRLTTQSNTFTVHYTVQALKNANSDPAVWDEKKGAILGEFRGATTIERFIDPSNNSIPDYATDVNAPSLETFYQWRTIRNQAFSQ